ncbi:hypothetical protein MGN70_008637 [Eutypa lata]|nr:hypothetical protein MGN70_008637 [Eutypa lata]
MTAPGAGFTIRTPTGELCVDGLMIYQLRSIIHRDPVRSRLERGGRLSAGRGIVSDKSLRPSKRTSSRRCWKSGDR